MGNSTHFVSMVLIDNQWLFYDGMGRYDTGIQIPKLKVFDRRERSCCLASFTLSCIFYEVQPIDKISATLMSNKIHAMSISPMRWTMLVRVLQEPINEQNEDFGPAVDADFDNLFNKETFPNNQEMIEAQIKDVAADVGAAYDNHCNEGNILHEQDAIEVKIEDVSVSVGAVDDDRFNEDPFLNEQDMIKDNLSREETIQNKQDTSDSEDRAVIGPGTT
jgi:hypothetical protein